MTTRMSIADTSEPKIVGTARVENIGPIEPQQETGHGALAAPRLADEGVSLAAIDPERHCLSGNDTAERSK